MTRKLIVHAGANKTGSSAIQRFLSLNHLALREAGIVVPSQTFTVSDQVQGFHVFAFEKFFQDPDGRTKFELAMQGLDKTPSGARTILLSAENLAARPEAPDYFSGLLEKFDLQVVLYVRRQDDLLLSSWQQWYSKIGSDLWSWLLSEVGVMGNWRTHLENWERVVPRERITVRVFERSRLEGGNVITDFHRILGLDRPIDELKMPARHVNPSYSDAIVDLVKGNELIFDNAHDNAFYKLVHELTGDRYFKNGRHSQITVKQRLAILQMYDVDNQWVKDRYFPDLEGGLFSPPRDEDYDYVSADQLQAEKLEFITTMLYRMHRQGK